MIDLERIALQRSEEQMAEAWRKDPHKAKLSTCECGTCLKCRKWAAVRRCRARAAGEDVPVKRKGPSAEYQRERRARLRQAGLSRAMEGA